jgi:hypothetical protein
MTRSRSHRRLAAFRKPLSWVPAVLAWIVIVVAPLVSPACCCELSAASRGSIDVPPCCQSDSATQSAPATQLALATQSVPPRSDTCCHEAATCDRCDNGRPHCPCDVRDAIYDQIVTIPTDEFQETHVRAIGDLVAILPWSASDIRRLLVNSFAIESRSKSMTSTDRCALLCRWLN